MAEHQVPDRVRSALGPVTLLSPRGTRPRQVDATRGHLWHWQGDGVPMVSLLVGVRETRLGGPEGPSRALGPAIDELAGRVDEVLDVRRPLEVAVPGALAATGALVSVLVGGRALRVALVLGTEGTWMHRIEVTVLDTEEGRVLQETVLGSLEIHSWRRPS